MSSGDFHGGDTHSGSFHDSDIGGSFGGGGDYYGSPGDYYSDGGAGNAFFSSSSFISAGMYGLIWLLFIIINASFNFVSGFKVLDLILITSGIVLLALGMKDYRRTFALSYIKRGKMPKHEGSVWHGKCTLDALGDSKSWAVEGKNHYQISFLDGEFGPDNAEKVYDTMKRTPGIIWMNLAVWVVISVISIISHVFFYELIIPAFENAVMSDQAFAFIDALTHYLPSVIVLLCGAACFIIVRVRDNILHKCAVRIAKDNEAVEERLKTEEYIAFQLSKKWYYNTCPNCGAEASATQSACKTCGSSLEVPDFERSYPGSVHRLTSPPASFSPDSNPE